MGSSCRIVASDRELAQSGADLVRSLEQRWSRFLPSSEISALNECSGRVTVVSNPTYLLIERAEHARRATGGAYNPLMLDQLVRLGYARSWDEIDRSDLESGDSAGQPVCSDPIELYPEVSAVRLPDGVRFDPGGIGKGLAGDVVARYLCESGSSSAQVELGGDVCLRGKSWAGGEWHVQIDDNDHGLPNAGTISLAEGGVATSSVLRHRWINRSTTTSERTEVHHLIDAATGRPAETDLSAVTAVAPELWWAEVLAKVALMAGSERGREIIDAAGATGVFIPRVRL